MWIKIAKIVCLSVLILVISAATILWYLMRPMLSFDESKIPRDLITASFMDFDRIYMVSKFRSAAGHDFSQGVKDETCRTMKHYFNTSKFNNTADTKNPYRSQPTADAPNIKIYAPFDGKVKTIETGHTGVTANLSPNKYPNFRVRIFHIDLLPGIKFGTQVTAGQQIGTIGPMDGNDISIEALTFMNGDVLLSYFDVMTNSVFKPYADLGFQREDLVISKAYRDAHPFKCGGPSLTAQNKPEEAYQHEGFRDWTEDFLYLKEDPYPRPGQSPVHIGPPDRNL